MKKSVLNWKQVVGLEPISKEEFLAALDESQQEIERGETISIEEAYAEFKMRCKARNAEV